MEHHLGIGKYPRLLVYCNLLPFIIVELALSQHDFLKYKLCIVNSIKIPCGFSWYSEWSWNSSSHLGAPPNFPRGCTLPHQVLSSYNILPGSLSEHQCPPSCLECAAPGIFFWIFILKFLSSSVPFPEGPSLSCPSPLLAVVSSLHWACLHFWDKSRASRLPVSTWHGELLLEWMTEWMTCWTVHGHRYADKNPTSQWWGRRASHLHP